MEPTYMSECASLARVRAWESSEGASIVGERATKETEMAWELLDWAGKAAMQASGAEARTTDGRHVYSMVGRGALSPMILLHGVGASALSWARIARSLLREAGRIWMPDLPGHGFSGAPGRWTLDGLFEDLERQLTREISEPVVLVGHSLGAMMAVRFTVRHPELVRRLVLVTPAGGTVAEGAWRGVRPHFEVKTNADARALLDRMLSDPSWTSRLLAPYLRETYARPSVRALVDSVRVSDMLTASELRRVRPPTLLLWGGRERLLPASDLEHFRAHLPGSAEIEVIEGWGHGVVLDRPGEVARRIVDFASRG